MTNVFQVNLGFEDPVNPKGGEVNLATLKGKPFYGLFGFGRENGDKEHRGFDYKTIDPKEKGKGDAVIAVSTGMIVRVRFGHINGSCAFKENIKNNSYLSENCEKCSNKRGCYGVHVWLKIAGDKNYYAVYAHLSELSEKIIDHLPNKTITNTVDFKETINVTAGDIIGKSGRTGVACERYSNNNQYKWPPHLHFECRKGNAVKIPERNEVISPNNIIKTQFLVMKGSDCCFDEYAETTTWSNVEKHLQDKWREIFKNINRFKINKETYETYAESANRTVEIIEPIIPKHPFVKDNQSLMPEMVSRKARYSMDVLTTRDSDKGDNKQNPIAPYQLVKCTLASFVSERSDIGFTIVDDDEYFDDNDIEKCIAYGDINMWNK